MEMRRGDLYWANLEAPWGQRPVAIVSRQSAVRVRASVCIAIVTSRIRGLDSEVNIDQEDGMPKSCVISCDNLLTIPKKQLGSFINRLPKQKSIMLDNSLRFALGLD
jgi:mRNA interferase MazF